MEGSACLRRGGTFGLVLPGKARLRAFSAGLPVPIRLPAVPCPRRVPPGPLRLIRRGGKPSSERHGRKIPRRPCPALFPLSSHAPHEWHRIPVDAAGTSRGRPRKTSGRACPAVASLRPEGVSRRKDGGAPPTPPSARSHQERKRSSPCQIHTDRRMEITRTCAPIVSGATCCLPSRRSFTSWSGWSRERVANTKPKRPVVNSPAHRSGKAENAAGERPGTGSPIGKSKRWNY